MPGSSDWQLGWSEPVSRRLLPGGGKIKRKLLFEHRNADCVSRIAHGQTTFTVVVKQPEVEHALRMRQFEPWNGWSPAEMVLKSRLRDLLVASQLTWGSVV
jgi:hypothetical protein